MKRRRVAVVSLARAFAVARAQGAASGFWTENFWTANFWTPDFWV